MARLKDSTGAEPSVTGGSPVDDVAAVAPAPVVVKPEEFRVRVAGSGWKVELVFATQNQARSAVMTIASRTSRSQEAVVTDKNGRHVFTPTMHLFVTADQAWPEV
jgi:hypothetical protein